MNDNADPELAALGIRLRQILLELARREETIALSEAAAVPYWAPHPVSVIGHRAAAQALRSEADRFLQAS
jgi:hypothetical protein